ncbi:hypothetical protein LJR235_001384 [Pararhizobium sp. LjRoot235]|uniref:hypothetical protein n=1 Tax=Pararhizobium sp. LjRoot235 TaxID=3342291 RepID=UPI003ECE9D87
MLFKLIRDDSGRPYMAELVFKAHERRALEGFNIPTFGSAGFRYATPDRSRAMLFSPATLEDPERLLLEALREFLPFLKRMMRRSKDLDGARVEGLPGVC